MKVRRERCETGIPRVFEKNSDRQLRKCLLDTAVVSFLSQLPDQTGLPKPKRSHVHELAPTKIIFMKNFSVFEKISPQTFSIFPTRVIGSFQNFFPKSFHAPKYFSKNFSEKFSKKIPGPATTKPDTGIPVSHAVIPIKNHPRNPQFRDPDHPQSGSYKPPVVPLFRNGAPYAPGLGSADPLLCAKLLEVFA
jgi:hypothetical protein